MSLKTRGEMIIEFISFRETEIQIKLFESYLNILFDSLKSSCGFTKEVFIFLFPKIPFLIKEKFYEYLLKKNNTHPKYFNKKIFVDTFLSIMYRPQKYLFKLFIDFFDYTNDSIIYSDDVNVIFYHIHHYNGNSDKLIYVKKFIYDIFSYKKFLKRKEFIFKIKERNSNLFYLFIFSLLYSLFQKKDILNICENLYIDLDIKRSPIFLLEQDYLFDKFEIVPPTQDLIEYLNQKYNVNLIEKPVIIFDDKNDDSLDELNDFENELIFMKDNLSNITNIKFQNLKFVKKQPKKVLKSVTVDEQNHIALVNSNKKKKKAKVKFSFTPKMKEKILLDLKQNNILSKKQISKFNGNKTQKSKSKELKLSFVKSKYIKAYSNKRKVIFPKEIFYPIFDLIYYSFNESNKLSDVVLRIFESCIIIEENRFYKKIIPIPKLFYVEIINEKEYKGKLLFPIQLISQLSYKNKYIYTFYFLSFHNREKFIYQLNCILENPNFKNQYILDELIKEENYYSIYLGRRNNLYNSTIIKINTSRLEEINDLDNSEKYYIKVIHKNNLDSSNNIMEEIAISKLLSNIKFPNINNIENLIEDNENIYIIFERYFGECILQYQKNSIEEKFELIKQLYKGVKALHNIGIIHSNLNPNLIFVDEFQKIIITNANKAHINLLFESNSFMIRKNKIDYFDCPEIINGNKCNYKIDIWNIGLITFFLLYGFVPLNKDNYKTFNIEKSIKEINWNNGNKMSFNYSNKELFNSLNKLIIDCLNTNVEERGNEIEEILKIKKTQNTIFGK